MSFAALAAIMSVGMVSSAGGQQTLASFAGGSFAVDPLGVSGPYGQDSQGIFFEPTVSLGDTVGGFIPEIAGPSGIAAWGLIMRVAGANPNLPFSIETLDANFSVTARFTGSTFGVGQEPTFVPLVLKDYYRSSPVVGLQFTWDGGGEIRAAVLAVALVPASPPAAQPVVVQPQPAPPAANVSKKSGLKAKPKAKPKAKAKPKVKAKPKAKAKRR
jgi:hypothetical protein